jgi:pSer/pThr/pTyr-binding forkhead associated (FHA) protein
MKPGRRKFLLALVGVLSAVIAFQLAMPYVESLGRPNLSPSDPRFKFQVGTLWGTVEYACNGAFLVGPVCFILSLGRGMFRAILALAMGLAVGALAGYVANGGADSLGIATESRLGSIPFLPQAIWSVVVPAVYAFSIAAVLGPTAPRLRRAIYASYHGTIGSFVAVLGAQAVVMALVAKGRFTLDPGRLGDGGLALAKASLPVWEATAAAAGFAIGAIFGLAEQASRAASLLLVLGRNEGREWNLDSPVSRIGSAEGLEVMVSRIPGVAPVHACIVRNPDGYAIQESGQGPIFLNGALISGGAWLNNGDKIELGQALLLFKSKVRANPGVYAMPVQAVPIPAPIPLPYATAVAPAPVPQPQPQQSAPYLVDAFGTEYKLAPGSNSLGRDPASTVPLAWDSSVSRQHAEIILDSSGTRLTDLGSKNGTKLNGAAVQNPVPLQNGDHVQVGHVSLTFRS